MNLLSSAPPASDHAKSSAAVSASVALKVPTAVSPSVTVNEVAPVTAGGDESSDPPDPMMPVAVASASVAPEGLLSVSVKSSRVVAPDSSSTGTLTVLDVSPDANVRVPVVLA